MLLLIVASLVLPSVLGCCAPDKFQGKIYRVESRYSAHLTVDFTAKKVLIRNINPNDTVDFQLLDWGNGWSYNMLSDGNCQKTQFPFKTAFPQCTPTDAKDEGDRYLGDQDLKFTTHTFMTDAGPLTISQSKDKCYPVFTFAKLPGGRSLTTIYADVDENVTDDAFNVDVDNCVESVLVG